MNAKVPLRPLSPHVCLLVGNRATLTNASVTNTPCPSVTYSLHHMCTIISSFIYHYKSYLLQFNGSGVFTCVIFHSLLLLKVAVLIPATSNAPIFFIRFRRITNHTMIWLLAQELESVQKIKPMIQMIL